ncbi:MAG: helix-turn-helix transcriptional regulator [Acidimicrobiia bacterium]
MRIFTARTPRRLPPFPRGLRSRKPRDYLEWSTLRRWGQLPDWEELAPGYMLREARERAELTQGELAARLGTTQQAVSQAERWETNPTVAFMRRWADACGVSLEIEFERF